ncbi:hypothetical protein [Pseudarthrobacter chlorophenolicus]|uniref:hypothetical protein n=1 Tax=Pseudarthrobacter chlorophenolicus TaxID=85085 RepID=UPI00088A89E9|nr:hypothetical protein [Pseudarthrobacter chlorophenolicus]SDR09613.1 levanbiose-producing levanase [Pseudarthrobacter chlorophenolicus]
MPPELPRTVLTALASAVTRRPILWAAVALAAVVVLVLSLVLAGQARTGPEAEARRVLGGCGSPGGIQRPVRRVRLAVAQGQ